MSIEQTLNERSERYGRFEDHAAIAQKLQDDMRATAGWSRLAPDQKQALSVIADKIARILNGDPTYADNWHDIMGYAKLVDDRLNKPVAPSIASNGFSYWPGGDIGALLDDLSLVTVWFRDGGQKTARVGDLYWGHGSSAKANDIVGWKHA